MTGDNADGAYDEGGPALLEARDVSKHFGGVTALDSANFSCRGGEIHALLGANGAGKSTLVKILSGVQSADSGEIRLGGKPVSLSSPADAAAHGVATVFQELSLFPHLTVAENVMIGHEPVGPLRQIRRRAVTEQVTGLLKRLHIDHISPADLVGDLSLADRQLVEIAKALSHDPRVLILDEGTSALGGQEVQRLFELLRGLRPEGKAVVFISHRMSEIRELVDRMSVFRNGRDVGTVPADQADENEIVEMMLGQRVEQSFPERVSLDEQAETVLETRNLHAGERLRDISLSLRRGEVLGIAGLEGQGQGELLLALFGAYRRIKGDVLVRGQKTRLGTPWRAKRAGLVLIPEDRKSEGLIQPMSVRDNLSLANLDRLSRLGFIRGDEERRFVDRVIERMNIKAASLDQPVRSLSGGNQQKLVLGKWIETGGEVFLFYDPTRGIDVGTKQSVYQLIDGLARESKGVILYTTEDSELVGLCHRVLVMDDGTIVRELAGDDITETNILSASLGVSGSRGEGDIDEKREVTV